MIIDHDCHALSSRDKESHEQYAKHEISDLYLDHAFVTSKGGREENQDCFAEAIAADGTRVFCVADGLGGHAGGRVASEVVVNTVLNDVKLPDFKFEDPLCLSTMFEHANQQVVKKQQQTPEFSEMRSTLVVLLIKDNLALWAHVGDVRLYMIRDQAIYRQTKDHSVPQMLFETGDIAYEEIRNHPDRSKLLCALGDPKKTPRLAMSQYYMQLQQNDYFHLSSDGFWEWIDEALILKMLKQSKNMSIATGSMEGIVVKTAKKEEPEYDNYTALNLWIKQAKFNAEYWHKTRYKIKEKT